MGEGATTAAQKRQAVRGGSAELKHIQHFDILSDTKHSFALSTDSAVFALTPEAPEAG